MVPEERSLSEESYRYLGQIVSESIDLKEGPIREA
jgi:hypothetical protein